MGFRHNFRYHIIYFTKALEKICKVKLKLSPSILGRLKVQCLYMKNTAVLLSYFLCKLSFVVQPLSCVWLLVTTWTAACQASLSFTISWRLLKLISTGSVMPSSQLIFCGSFLLLPLIFPRIKVFSKESTLHIRWAKYWKFSFSFSVSNEYSGWFLFRIDWLDLLAVQGTLKSLLQHHSLKASVLQRSGFLMVQLSFRLWLLGKPKLLYTDLCRQSKVSAI